MVDVAEQRESDGGLSQVEYRSACSLLVFADTSGGEERLRQIARGSGCRVSGSASIDGAAERLQRQAATDAVLVSVEREPGPAFDRLLARLQLGAVESRYPCFISAPAALIDRIAAQAFHPDVHHLCDADPEEWTATLLEALHRRAQSFNDVTKGQGTARLQQLSEEVGRIASILATLSEDETVAAAAGAAEVPDDGAKLEAAQIRAIIRARRLRDQFFQADIFADPAWDMLLDLMAARLDEQRVAVSSLCIAAAVPPTTALRWIKNLCDRGLFVRVADPQDGRRVFIELADRTATALEAYLKAAQRIAPTII